MFTEEEILEIIKKKISEDESLGEKNAGSGHSGFVDYDINLYDTKQLSEDTIEIKYHYHLVVESEFTSYPDNPPMEYPRLKLIVVNKDRKILKDVEMPSPEIESETGINFNWELAKGEVMYYLNKLRTKLKTQHGLKTEPFQYPPQFDVKEKSNAILEYYCIIKVYFPKEDTITYHSEHPSGIIKQIESDFQTKFLSHK
jgi:hypothetical protein